MNDSSKNKAVPIFEKYVSRIESGLLGYSGSKFWTVRELAEIENISLVTSQKIFSLLEQYGTIKCFNKKYYLSYGRMNENCELDNTLNERASHFKKPLIGIIVPDLKNPFFSALIQKVSSFVIDNGFMPIVMSYQSDSKIESDMLNLLVSMGVKGILSCPNSNQSVKDLYSKCVRPVVFISKKFSNNDEYYSSVDNYGAAKRVARHLTEMGYRQFMYIGTDLNPDEDMRYKGYFDELKNNGFDSSQNDNCHFSLKEFKTLPYYIVQKIINADKPLGIFCYHDIIAECVLSACKKNNLSVPDDVGIVGFDDLPITTQVEPSLSTIAYSFDKMAKTTVIKLINRINRTENESENSFGTISHMLIIRGSSRRIQ